MPHEHRVYRRASQPHVGPTTAIEDPPPWGVPNTSAVMPSASSQAVEQVRPPDRGIAARVHSITLQERIRARALLLAHRFRVIRTIDIAVACFAERPFKAALTAAQRAMRGMVKDELLRRYRTDRFQTVYALTRKGVQWLELRGMEASASVRRVSDMSNPEHRLWAQFLTLGCEARGLQAYTEQELMAQMAKPEEVGSGSPQGLISVNVQMSRGLKRLQLRPDAIAVEADGVTWFEVDRSARGADRSASLKALVLAIGRQTQIRQPLRRVVVLTRTPRIEHRVRACLDALVRESGSFPLSEGRRLVRAYGDGAYEVVCTFEESLPDGRTQLVDLPAGHVIVQALPVWLPKYRLDGRDGHVCDGWFDENYLPYRRLAGMPPWPLPQSPLLRSSA